MAVADHAPKGPTVYAMELEAWRAVEEAARLRPRTLFEDPDPEPDR